MYCRNCGSQINDDAVVCIHCGETIKQHNAESEENPLAIIGFVLSFLSQVAGLICSIIAYRNCNENPNLKYKSLALAGIIISSVFLALTVLTFIIWLAMVLAIIGGVG